ncbi:hypothetical protein [Deinococcus reticulitermitis]|uniref:hypothetical protein n=1 Tax=Deinococcus reticulitermitis TaxID=856736 RepID=UPI001FE1A5D2|nr:hypothetical protein [Deinococcus reticulitermitis]
MRRLLPALLLLAGLLLAGLALGVFAALGGSGPLWLRSLGSVALAGPGPGNFTRGLLLALLASAAFALAARRGREG